MRLPSPANCLLGRAKIAKTAAHCFSGNGVRSLCNDGEDLGGEMNDKFLSEWWWSAAMDRMPWLIVH